MNTLFRGLAVLLLLAASGSAIAQTTSAPSAPIYYNVLGLGSSEGDSAFWYPYPMAVLELKDTAKHVVRVRFTNLGILGNEEETIIQPTHVIDSMTVGYRASAPLLHFSVPVTPYLMFIETIDRASGKVIEIRPFPYRMNVERFAGTRVDRVHEPQSALADPLLRREFKPALLPLTLETNPGWRVREQFDTSGTYSLTYLHPESNTIMLTMTMRSASIQEIDSATWADFKAQSRQTFGDRGIATNSVGDFVVDDRATRSVVRAGYEMLAKREDGGMDYIVAYLTPKSIILLMAPLTGAAPSAEYDYYRAIARSFKLK